PSRANWVAIYFAARSPPRSPGYRPSSRSSDKTRTCARIFSASMEASAFFTAGGTTCAKTPADIANKNTLAAKPLLVFIDALLKIFAPNLLQLLRRASARARPPLRQGVEAPCAPAR